MIWLFCKKKRKKQKKQQQNKTQALNLCFLAQKKVPPLFLWSDWKGWKERGEERGGASWARHKRRREGWAWLCPPTPTPKKNKTHRASGWPNGAQGQKVRGKVFFVPSIPLVLKDTYAHPYSHTNTRSHTCTCIHTDSYLLEGGSDLSLCARPTRKRRSTLGVFHNVEEPLWKHRLVRLLR